MPLMVLSMIMVTHSLIVKNIAQQTPTELLYYFMYFAVPDIVSIPVLYLLAMWYRKVPAIHMRYIVACSVIFFNPALGRIFLLLGMETELTIIVVYAICDLILAGFLVNDVIKGKPYKPYVYSLIFLAICHGSLLYVPYTAWWQSIAAAVVKNFF
jgi:hypothetical protein